MMSSIPPPPPLPSSTSTTIIEQKIRQRQEHQNQDRSDWEWIYDAFVVQPKGVSYSCHDERCKNVVKKYLKDDDHFHNHYVSISKIIEMLNNDRFDDLVMAEVQGHLGCWYNDDCRPTAYTMARFGKIMKAIPYHIISMKGTTFTIEIDY